MSEFDWCEQQGRELFKTVLESAKVIEYEFSLDQYSIWDAKYSTDKQLNLVEIKVRKQNFDSYPDWILEYNKYTSLLKEVKQLRETTDKTVKAYYVNFFNNGYFCFWDLAKVKSENFETMWCKSTTAVNSGYRWKDVLKLNIKDAVFFGRLENNKVINEKRSNG